MTDLPALQRFVEANPLYFEVVEGLKPGPQAAQDLFHDAPPPAMPYRQRWVLGVPDEQGDWVAVAEMVADLMAAGVWHLGLFIVATARHGSGDALRWYAALEAWAHAAGADWLRLGVVRGNVRAERFWERRGYHEQRVRCGLVMGQCTQDVRVMVKPLTGRPGSEYLRRVPRDHPDAP
ncbi:GNAT family N-acetyltransferase [Inhella gelatinilytica]|uniref:GNAT family N-acetyltransferase n=1 Tax=Inhella gelatinilytica TaxID=2795030 RepID=A0A931ITF6_9BURK|nr:GNAT family N-acetyltransferase [Inhella gelatinilytica]MBH9552400.1 GNAT family N-acetyltransferase [Inhella gelatinilytica]